MVQKRPFGEEDLYEVSSKQPRHEPSCQLDSVLELSRESVAVDAYASGNKKLFCYVPLLKCFKSLVECSAL